MKNREIKFRAWDDRTKTMHQDVNPFRWDFVIKNTWHKCEKSNGNGILGSGGTEAEFLVPSVSYTDLMQYTGLKDKNGVEIYEGDILECYNRKGQKMTNYAVNWNSKLSAFYKTSITGKEELGLPLPTGVFVHSMVVLGNIFERPELLTPTASK